MNTISLQYLSLCFFFTVLFLSLCTIFCIWIWSTPLAMNYFSSDILVFLHVLGPSYGFLYSRSLTTIMPHTVPHVTLLVSRGKFTSGLDFFLSPPENKKVSNPLKNTQKIQGGLAHQKCYARVQPGHSQRQKNLGSRVALLPGKFLRVRKVFARINEKTF